MRRLIVGSAMGMAAAVAAAGMLVDMDTPRPLPRRLDPQKPKRRKVEADRSKKQYLLKGIRP